MKKSLPHLDLRSRRPAATQHVRCTFDARRRCRAVARRSSAGFNPAKLFFFLTTLNPTSQLLHIRLEKLALELFISCSEQDRAQWATAYSRGGPTV